MPDGFTTFDCRSPSVGLGCLLLSGFRKGDGFLGSHPEGFERRVVISYDQIAPVLRQAIMACKNGGTVS